VGGWGGGEGLVGEGGEAKVYVEGGRNITTMQVHTHEARSRSDHACKGSHTQLSAPFFTRSATSIIPSLPPSSPSLIPLSHPPLSLTG
jgi:hypothetical protein